MPKFFTVIMKHIGNEINRILTERKVVKKRFAEEIGTSEINLQKIIKKASINTALLSKIANALCIPVEYFFDEEVVINKTDIGHKVSGSKNKVEGSITLADCEGELERAKVQIAYLKREIEDKEKLIDEKEKLIAEKERLICVLMEKK